MLRVPSQHAGVAPVAAMPGVPLARTTADPTPARPSLARRVARRLSTPVSLLNLFVVPPLYELAVEMVTVPVPLLLRAPAAIPKAPLTV